MEQERFHRLRELKKMFDYAGITPLHENCMNYGGMSWKYTLKLLENVPGLKLVYDTGNPIFTDNRSRPKPYPKQSSWEFYENVREHISYIHIKDGKWNEQDKSIGFTFPGEGNGDVHKILNDLLANGYDGGISIEPHLSVVHHDKSISTVDEIRYANYIEYGRRTEKMVTKIKRELQKEKKI